MRIDGRRSFSEGRLYLRRDGRLVGDTGVPFPTSVAISAGTINDKLDGILDPKINGETTLGALPNPLHFLAAKVTKDGDVYVAPL